MSSKERTGVCGMWGVGPLMPDMLVGGLRLPSLFGRIFISFSEVNVRVKLIHLKLMSYAIANVLTYFVNNY